MAHTMNKKDSQPRVFLKEWRMVNGLSQTDLAKRMGVSKSEVSRLESGARKVSINWLEEYAKGLGIVREQLMSPPGVTVMRREDVMPVGAPDVAPAPAPASRAGIGSYGLSAAPPFMFVATTEREYLLIDSAKGVVVGKLTVS